MRIQNVAAEGAGPSALRMVRGVEVPGFSLRRYRFRAGHQISRHEHPTAALVWVLRGNYRATMRREEYASGVDELWSVPAAMSHSEVIGPTGSDALLVFPTVCEGPSNTKFFERLRRIPVGSFRPLARRLIREFHATDSAAPLALEACLLELTDKLMHVDLDGTGESPRWLDTAREYLDACAMAPCKMDDVASVVGVHRSHLGRVFRSRFGCSPGDYLRVRRLERAARLVVTSDEPLANVATRCGFFDQSHFTNSFRRQFGVTPARYRKGSGNSRAI